LFKWDREGEKRANKIITIVLFFILLLINALYLWDSVVNDKEYTSATLLFINILAIVITYGIFSVTGLINMARSPFMKLIVDFSIAMVATCVVSVWLVSIVFAINFNYIVNFKVAFISSMVIIVLFVYYIFIKDHT